MDHLNLLTKRAVDFINTKIFSIKPTSPKMTTRAFPSLSDEAHEVIESIKSHVISCGEKFSIEPAGFRSCKALLIEECSDTLFFWEIDFNLVPRFYFVEKSKIKQRFYCKAFMEAYFKKFERLPPEPDLIIGLDWEIEPHAGGHWLTCTNPPINGEIEYSSLLTKFQNRYTLKSQSKAKAKTGKNEDSGSLSSFDLKPSFQKGGDHDFN
jgi:hypothetical protein